MDDIFLRYCDMPCSIRAYTYINSDGSYTIVINSKLSTEMRLTAYQHEMHHIKSRDYDKKCSVGIIEINAHGTY